MKMMKRSLIIGDDNMSNLTSASGEASASSVSRNNETPTTTTTSFLYSSQHSFPSTDQQQEQAQPQPEPQPLHPPKKKKSLPGNPDPDAEVIALSPKSLLATNRFVCEICNKGFQRDQNLQLHRRGHNLPWKLKQRNNKEVIRKKVYVCPEVSCVHHNPSRALGDLTGIKKHFCRKHGEKKWKCDKCSKRYAVQSDWKAHSKICGTKEYRCDCGTLFSRRDSFITHRAFCDALTEEINAKTNPNPSTLLSSSSSSFQNIGHIFHSFPPIKNEPPPPQHHHQHEQEQQHQILPSWLNMDHHGTSTLNLPPPHSSSSSTPLMFLSSNNLNSLDPTSLSLLAPTTSHDHHYIHPSHHQNPNPSSTSTTTSGITSLLAPFQTQYHHHYHHGSSSSSASPLMSATALLQKASQMGVVTSSQHQQQQATAAAAGSSSSSIMCSREDQQMLQQLATNDKDVTTDFLGLSGFSNGGEFVNVDVGVGGNGGGFELMSSSCSTTNDGKQNI